MFLVTGLAAGLACGRREPLPLAVPLSIRVRVQRRQRCRCCTLLLHEPGRLRGHVAHDRDLFDMFEFQREATELPWLTSRIAAPPAASTKDQIKPTTAIAAPSASKPWPT
jgi:hypothetical protein